MENKWRDNKWRKPKLVKRSLMEGVEKGAYVAYIFAIKRNLIGVVYIVI
jgi:hypothetical protein